MPRARNVMGGGQVVTPALCFVGLLFTTRVDSTPSTLRSNHLTTMLVTVSRISLACHLQR